MPRETARSSCLLFSQIGKRGVTLRREGGPRSLSVGRESLHESDDALGSDDAHDSEDAHESDDVHESDDALGWSVGYSGGEVTVFSAPNEQRCCGTRK